MDEQHAYVISYFNHLMNGKEKQAYGHLVAALKDPEQRLFDAIAWEESRGNSVPEPVKSYMAWRRSLSDDPEVLQFTSGGLDAFLRRTARRTLAEDRDKVFLNKCPSCGALARTPRARQCRRCGHDWHHVPTAALSTEDG